MDHCCDTKVDEVTALRGRHRQILKIVLALNAIMFLTEFTAGLIAHSTALLADSLDMLGDAFVYGLSLYALQRSDRWRTGAALTKGIIMALFGLGIVGEAVVKIVIEVTPEAIMMGIFGLLALAANTTCLLLLLRYRTDDLNMHSTWLCSRNDVIANGGVLLAAAGVAVTGTLWPDILIGLLIAGLFLHSAWKIIQASLTKLRSDITSHQKPI